MKKISFLFIAVAFVGFIALNACKSAPAPVAEPAATEEVVEEPAEAVAADTAAAVVAEPAAAE